jgi:hypothetical protein
MKTTFFLRSAAAAAMAGVLAMPAGAATLIGNSITAAYYFPDLASVYGNFSVSPSATFIVGAGVEATGTVDGSLQQTFDFAASSLTMTLNNDVTWSNASYNGWQFVNNSAAFGAISSVTGIDPSRVSVTGNTLNVNWQGITFSTNDAITVNFGVVPEPSSWMLLVGGFGLTGLAMRRRRYKVVAA